MFRHFIGRAVGWFAARCGVSRQGEFLRWWAQRRAERQNARVRQDTTAQDRRLDKELAFAGRAE
ncbi:MAG TPA: hypothetical protein VLX09_27260 [Stellaceae bacterium]|nr:hypothetical protein [Stellaceae bacterium]